MMTERERETFEQTKHWDKPQRLLARKYKTYTNYAGIAQMRAIGNFFACSSGGNSNMRIVKTVVVLAIIGLIIGVAVMLLGLDGNLGRTLGTAIFSNSPPVHFSGNWTAALFGK